MSFTVIEGSKENGPAQAGSVREYGRARRMWNRVVSEVWHFRLRRWLPRLVWLGDEIDVVVTLTEDKLFQPDPVGALFSGGFYEIEKQLRDKGILFDTGMGAGGRDWEWDFSLRGPISVRFKGRAAKPERRVRKEIRKPELVPTVTVREIGGGDG